MTPADHLRQAAEHLEQAAKHIQAGSSKLRQPYVAPIAMALADVEHAKKSISNTARLLAVQR